jgi:hypothetical protein
MYLVLSADINKHAASACYEPGAVPSDATHCWRANFGTELSQRATAEADSTDTLTPSVDQRTANFTARWSDLPKSVDLDQHESTPRDNYASSPLKTRFRRPVPGNATV